MSTDSGTLSGERPVRPDSLSVDYSGIPSELKERDTWVVWRYEWKADREEWTKVPIDPQTGRRAKPNDPDTWRTFEVAREFHENPDTDSDGLGFLFSESDSIVGIDIDDARSPDTGSPTDTAKDIINELDSFAEVSPSGTGYHVFVCGELPDGAKNRTGKIEIYDQSRYFTVTGEHVDVTPLSVEDRQDALLNVHQAYVADDTDENATTDTPSPSNGSVDLSDTKLIEKAKSAKNGDKFSRLWDGNTSGYPSPSEADSALVSLLLFWTGGDHDRVDRLFRKSGLNRGKWEERADYRRRTIQNADRQLSEYYDPGQSERASPPTPEALELDNSRNRSLLHPGELVALAGIDTDDPVSAIADLKDRTKAAWVWELIKESGEVHIRVRRDNGTLWTYENGIWIPDGERALRHAARQTLGSVNYGSNVLTELVAQAQSDPEREVEPDTFGLEPGYLAVENGLLDLQAAYENAPGALRGLEPEDYALTRIPVEYDPDAECPEWRSFVSEVVESSKAAIVQEYVGYCLNVGDMRFNKALLLVGSGANGKSTFLNVVRELLGEENTASKPVHKFSEENHVAGLYGKLANIDADLSSGSLSATGIAQFKRLVGDDTVTGRNLYEDSFQFQPTAKHLYAANQTPDVTHIVDDSDTAFWRRWLVVHFPTYFPPGARDASLEERLTTAESLSAVLNWAIEGFGRLMDQGRFSDGTTTPDDTRRRWQEWGESANEFVSNYVENDPDAPRLTTGEAYELYSEWCRRNDKDPTGQRDFTTTVKNSGLNVGHSDSIRIDGRVTRGYKSFGLTDDCRIDLDRFVEDIRSDDTDSDPGSSAGLDTFGGSE